MIYILLLLLIIMSIIISINNYLKMNIAKGNIFMFIVVLSLCCCIYLLVQSYNIVKTIKVETRDGIVEIVKTKFYDNEIIKQNVVAYLKEKYKNNEIIKFDNVSFKIVDRIQKFPRLENKKDVTIYFLGTINHIPSIPIVIKMDEI